MAYCTLEDVLLGEDMPLPRGVDVQRLIDQKADDIDAVVGRVYSLPIQFTVTDPVQKPWALMFKKANAYLVIGEIYLLAGGPRQDDAVLAIANQYLRQANAFLNGIENGKIKIPFLDTVETTVDDTAPSITNRDSFSRVEEFYNPVDPGRAPWIGHRKGASPWV